MRTNILAVFVVLVHFHLALCDHPKDSLAFSVVSHVIRTRIERNKLIATYENTTDEIKKIQGVLVNEYNPSLRITGILNNTSNELEFTDLTYGANYVAKFTLYLKEGTVYSKNTTVSTGSFCATVYDIEIFERGVPLNSFVNMLLFS